jgi:N-dimethylarginine dimethylaminohydrolase
LNHEAEAVIADMFTFLARVETSETKNWLSKCGLTSSPAFVNEQNKGDGRVINLDSGQEKS